MAKASDVKTSSVPASKATGRSGRTATRDDGVTPRPAVRRIVIPLDETAFADQARLVGVTLAQRFAAEVLLIRCYSERTYLPSGSATFGTAGDNGGQRPGRVNVGEPMRHPLYAALAYLEQREAEIAQAGLTVHTEAVQWPPSFAIVHLANRPLADLVVMVTHLGESGFPKSLTGSITHEVIEHITAHVPLLLLPVRWVADWQATRCPDVKEPRHIVVALIHQDRDTSEGGNPSVLAQSYAEIFAHSLKGTFTEWSLPPHAADSGIGSVAVKPLSKDAAPQHFGMFVMGGSPRATLASDAQYLLHTAHAPLLVVPEA